MSKPKAQLDLDAIVVAWLHSKKYRTIDLSEETMRAVLASECLRHRDMKRAVEEARRKLHQIAAAYLGDPDYESAEHRLSELASAGDSAAVFNLCRGIVAAHATTRERLAIIDEYYEHLFAITGKPRIILDLACGLNPLFLPWMRLPLGVHYHAYDIRKRRVEFLNHFFQFIGVPRLAKLQDVLVRPPLERGDVALLLQEAHRIEQREPGATRTLIDRLRTRFVVVSLPKRSLGRNHDVTSAHRHLFERIVEGSSWAVRESELGNELIYCIEKPLCESESGENGIP